MKRLSSLFIINPILVKEIRSRMRGPRAFITLTIVLLLMGGVMYGMLQLILVGARYSNVLSPQVGQALFAALAFLELFMICAVTPAVTAGAVSGEKEKQTYEMLMATPLSPTSILWGKLISALSYVLLLLFAAIPLASIVFIFGGVAPRDMVKALFVLLVVAITFGILGLFLSALFGRTGRATVASFLIVIALMVGPIFIAGLVGVLQGKEPPRWILAPSPISALSSTLAPTMGMDAGGSVFYILSGIFNAGVTPISQTSIPRPLYHYSIPLYALLSLILYMITTRLVQPTRRWRIRRRELVTGIVTLLVLVALIIGVFFISSGRYERAKASLTNPETLVGVAPAIPVVVRQAEKRVQVALEPTPTPLPPPAGETAAAGLNEEDHAAIYAAVARQLYTTDNTFGGKPPTWTSLYLVSTTNDGVGDPNTQQLDPTTLPDSVLKAVVEKLSDLPAKIMWMPSRDAVGLDANNGQVDGGSGVIFTFGNIHPQQDGTVLVPASLYFASLGAGGRTYILKNNQGTWEIVGSTGVEWIS